MAFKFQQRYLDVGQCALDPQHDANALKVLGVLGFGDLNTFYVELTLCKNGANPLLGIVTGLGCI